MAFKMAHNSLFSVLLRSPWWYSALIALFAIAVSLAVSKGQFLIFGITAALPFLGIAGFSAYRQFQRPSGKSIASLLQSARQMPPREMTTRLSHAYQEKGYDVVAHKGSAADIELTRGSKKILLASKKFKAANTGIEPLKQLVTSGEQHEATGYHYVTLGTVSANARKYAKDNDVELIQAEALAVLLDWKV